MMAGAGNRFCLYKDIPARFDAWDIDSMTEITAYVDRRTSPAWKSFNRLI